MTKVTLLFRARSGETAEEIHVKTNEFGSEWPVRAPLAFGRCQRGPRIPRECCVEKVTRLVIGDADVSNFLFEHRSPIVMFPQCR